MSEKVTIRADDFGELEGKVRYRLGRGLFLKPMRVLVGNTTPRDISDEMGENTLLMENTELLEAEVEINEDGQLVLELPDRDELHERFKENYEGGHELSEE